MQEASNTEVRGLLKEGREYVAYDDTNLEARIDYYLKHADKRTAIAGRANRRAAEFTFEAFWSKIVEEVEGTLLPARKSSPSHPPRAAGGGQGGGKNSQPPSYPPPAAGGGQGGGKNSQPGERIPTSPDSLSIVSFGKENTEEVRKQNAGQSRDEIAGNAAVSPPTLPSPAAGGGSQPRRPLLALPPPPRRASQRPFLTLPPPRGEGRVGGRTRSLVSASNPLVTLFQHLPKHRTANDTNPSPSA